MIEIIKIFDHALSGFELFSLGFEMQRKWQNSFLGALLLLSALFVEGHAALANECKSLIDATSIQLLDKISDLVATGDKIQFRITTKVSDPNVLDPFGGFVPLYIKLSNDLNGSKALFSGVPLSKKNLEEGGGTISKTIDWTIPDNFSGQYSLYVRLLIGGTSTGVCSHTFALQAQPSTFIYARNPAQTDIAPPVVRDVRFDKTSYMLGSKVLVMLDAVDQSPICTREAKDEGKQCRSTWHVAFKNENGAYHNFFPEAHRASKPGTYYAEFEIPGVAQSGGTLLLQPGSYTVEVYDVADVWDNYVHQSAMSLARTISVEN